MKFRLRYLWILAFVLLLSSAVTLYRYRDFEPRNEVLVFVTVGIDQSKVPAETSSYEIQRASEHFSDLILGWTLDPHFRANYLEEAGAWHTLEGQRQEKQNLLFTITNVQTNIDSNDLQAGEAFLRVLENQLGEYNRTTNQAYVLALKNLSYQTGSSNVLPLVGEVLFILITASSALFAFEYVSTRRRS